LSLKATTTFEKEKNTKIINLRVRLNFKKKEITISQIKNFFNNKKEGIKVEKGEISVKVNKESIKLSINKNKDLFREVYGLLTLVQNNKGVQFYTFNSKSLTVRKKI
jgi:hypothetical protein